MATNYEYSLTNSKGLGRVIYFHGLEFPIIICPTIHGEPLLTTQAFYYLEQLESVVRIRFEKPSNIPKHSTATDLERIFEYTIDNYLFEFSKKYPAEKLTSKVTEYKYWKNACYTCLGYDGNQTIALALDAANDNSIIDIVDENHPNKGYWYDWCLISNYTSNYIDNYVKSMKSVLSNSVDVTTQDHEKLGTGKFKLPLLRCSTGLLDYYQAMMLEVIAPDRIDVSKDRLLVSRGMISDNNFKMPLEVFHTTKHYDADLLSYYFAGVREHLPISQFRCFYNVLEYFFEEAPAKLVEKATTEKEQLSCVVRWITDSNKLHKFFTDMGQEYINDIEINLVSSSGININALPIVSSTLDRDVATWLYEIRCACVHSKKTKKGKPSARLVPYSQDEDLVGLAVPVVQMLAIACIETDGEVAT